jgi:hypothetical protein
MQGERNKVHMQVYLMNIANVQGNMTILCPHLPAVSSIMKLYANFSTKKENVNMHIQYLTRKDILELQGFIECNEGLIAPRPYHMSVVNEGCHN